MKNVFFFISLLAIAVGCKDDAVELSEAEQLQKDIATIDEWLAFNGITALADPSGLRYVITVQGTGVKPKIGNTVSAKYAGKFLKENVLVDKSTVFDQSTTAISFKLSQVIVGWQVGMQLLPKGSKATLYIPSGLGYGKQGYGSSIPANSNLFFDVELVDVK